MRSEAEGLLTMIVHREGRGLLSAKPSRVGVREQLGLDWSKPPQLKTKILFRTQLVVG